ncbi:hypothetical protein [Aureibacter tunicatorum]|uniref:Uncharacterized protein n=1 Tax=Aureibacter tunicatorum TaxID=866807 RepID=A0AAE3XP80_9BACT|nr:hypothetical protein [Aureibacter tunicatorum]MDR6240110.1 hypothetical protein [Aureibacter tunicatorum]BDD06009.1 hypothetical protein AUTU_34920 [Aureibacter tunicatorum]
MNEEKSAEQYLEDINEIKSLMAQSSKFISLSGLSGIFAGIFAILGALYGKKYIIEAYFSQIAAGEIPQINDYILHGLGLAFIIMASACVSGIFFSKRKASKENINFWDKTTQELIIHSLIPFLSGGVFCLALIYYGHFDLLPPMMLLIYGISVVSASKFTHKELFYLGISEIALAFASIFLLKYGTEFWIAGFGLFHIIYGIITYLKYERVERSH